MHPPFPKVVETRGTHTQNYIFKILISGALQIQLYQEIMRKVENRDEYKLYVQDAVEGKRLCARVKSEYSIIKFMD